MLLNKTTKSLLLVLSAALMAGAQSPNTNLLNNPGAETADTTDWTNTGSIPWQAWITGTDGVPSHSGNYFFFPGQSAENEMYQDVDISGLADSIDSGLVLVTASGYISGWPGDTDAGRMILEFRDGSGQVLLGNDTNYHDGTMPQWDFIDVTPDGGTAAPAGTRTLRFRLLALRGGGTDNDAYFDDLSLSYQLMDPNNQLPQKPDAPSGPTEAEAGDEVTFTASSTDPDGIMVRLVFDWGDGNTTKSILVANGATAKANHIYSAAGNYEVRVAAEDAQLARSPFSEPAFIEITASSIPLFVTEPYLQWVTQDAITIMWETDRPSVTSLEWGTSADETNNIVTGTSEFSSGGTTIHKVRITGLEPESQYYYRVPSEMGDATGTFRTAPHRDTPFSFGVWGDSQGYNHGSYAPDPLEPTKAMMRLMVEDGVDVGVSCGDLAENGGLYNDTRYFYLDRVAAYLGRHVAWFNAWGNHDAGNGAVLRQFADMPSQLIPGYNAGYGSFSFQYGNSFFICIDDSTRSNDVANWVEGELASTAAQEAEFRFVFVHRPPYCERWIDGDSFLRSSLVPLLQTYNVHICFSGHTHEYERGYLDGVYYVITGGGSWLDHGEPVVKDWAHMTVGGAHNIFDYVGGLVNEYTVVSINNDYLELKVYAVEPNGTPAGIIDEFTIGEEPVAIENWYRLHGRLLEVDLPTEPASK